MDEDSICGTVYLYELFSNDDIVSTLSDKYMVRSISSRSVPKKTSYNEMDLTINNYTNDFISDCFYIHAILYWRCSRICRRNPIYNYFCEWLCKKQINLKIRYKQRKTSTCNGFFK